jgi:chorismate-pyruvate lyase
MWQLSDLALLALMRETVAPDQIEWITMTQRLTRKLRETVRDYQFQLLKQEWKQLTPSEMELFSLAKASCEGPALVRSVVHKSGEKILVEGFSIIPKETFDCLSAELRSLEGKPIGDTILYDNPKVTRSAFYFQESGGRWERASLFFYRPMGPEEKAYPLMVRERFMEKLSVHEAGPSLG